MAASFCNGILASKEHQYIEYITKSPGILFDPVGTLRIMNDYFHIVIPVDVSPIKSHIENIKNVFDNVQFYCRESNEIDYSQCQNILQPLHVLYDDILRDFESISHIISTGISKRSAWFSGVGTVFKHIFGTLDEDDAKSYDDAIQVLYNNDKKLAESITKSIMVSQTAISKINDSLHEININQAKLNDVIDNLSYSIKNVSDVINVVSFKTKLNVISNILQSNLLTISFKIEDLLNSILFVKSNILHPSILTPNQMYNDITSNLKIVPKYKDFPVSLDLSNIHKLINVADLVCYYLNNKLMFIVKIPLVSLSDYNVYKNIPLPTPHISDSPNSFVMILPSEQYLAVSRDKSSYTYLKDFNHCKIIPRETYLCQITDIYAVFANPSCEIEIITKALHSLPENCPVKFISGDIDIWHKLNNNNWIFVQSKPTKLSIECNNVISDFTISGTGVLNMPTECIAFHKNVKLVRNANPSITIPYIYSEFNIINDSCCNINRFKEITINIPSSKIKTVNLNNLKSFKDNSDQIIDSLQTLEKPNLSNHISFPIFSILSFIVCLIILCYIILKLSKKRKYLCYKKPLDEPEPVADITILPRLRVT